MSSIRTTPSSPCRLALRACLYAVWVGFCALAMLCTWFFYGWQGFSPDGPPPGFKPEPIPWFFLKNFPVVLLGLLLKTWWFSLPMLIATVWTYRQEHPHTRKEQAREYDL